MDLVYMDLNGSRIQYSNHWYSSAADQEANTRVFNQINQLRQLAVEYSMLFTHNFVQSSRIHERSNNRIGLITAAQIKNFPDHWNLANPNMDEVKIKALNELTTQYSYPDFSILGELQTEPRYLNPIDIKIENNEWRLNPDYSHLNKYIKLNSSIVYLIKQNIKSIPQSYVYSILVIKDANYQFELTDMSKLFTSFKIPKTKEANDFRYFQFNVIPPNVINADEIIHKKIKSILGDLPEVSARNVVGTILIHSNDFDEHIECLKMIFHRCLMSNVKLCANESKFILQRFELEGFLIDCTTIRISNSIKHEFQRINNQMTINIEEVDRNWFYHACNIFKLLITEANLVQYNTLQKHCIEHTFEKWPLTWRDKAKDLMLMISNAVLDLQSRNAETHISMKNVSSAKRLKK